MAGASPGLLTLGVALWLTFVALRGLRWRVILGASAPQARTLDLTAITAVGFAINSVAPFKIGDVVRLASAARRARVGLGEAGATIVLERVLDVLALLAMALLAAGVSRAGSRGTGWAGLAAIAAVSTAVAGASLWLVHHEAGALRTFARLAELLPARFSPPAREMAASVLRGLLALRSGRRLLLTVVLSLATWTAGVLGSFAFFRALSPQLDGASLFLALTLFTISAAVSVTPGSVGTFEGFFYLVLTGFGARPAAVVTAAALITHIGSIAALLGAGLMGALYLRVRAVAPPPVGLQGALPGEHRP